MVEGPRLDHGKRISFAWGKRDFRGRRGVIRYIKQQGAPNIELCPREWAVSAGARAGRRVGVHACTLARIRMDTRDYRLTERGENSFSESAELATCFEELKRETKWKDLII